MCWQHWMNRNSTNALTLRKSVYNQQQIELGQADTKPRDEAEISRNNLIGKMTEAVFAKMFHNRYRIEVELDFNYYPRGE